MTPGIKQLTDLLSRMLSGWPPLEDDRLLPTDDDSLSAQKPKLIRFRLLLCNVMFLQPKRSEKRRG